jgi:hypothetical protein
MNFSGSLSESALHGILSRALTHASEFGVPDDDDLRMLKDLRPRFIGRSAFIWAMPKDDELHFEQARLFAARVHACDPTIVLQACIFEAIFPGLDRVPIPPWVFEAFGEKPENRCFRFEAMADVMFRKSNAWGDPIETTGSAPDITQPESQKWFYYRARRYLDAGYEALHLGQVHIIGARDHGYRRFAQLCEMIRDYASKQARRRNVLLDAHTHGILIHGRSLFDFHSRPISCRNLRDRPECLALIFHGPILGGRSPQGWETDALPTLIELDNWGGTHLTAEQRQDVELRVQTQRWGYDDIAWFAHQPVAVRQHFLGYAHCFYRLRHPAVYFQPPTRRTLGRAVVPRNGRMCPEYRANHATPACPEGFGDEDAIAALWAKPDPAQCYPPTPGDAEQVVIPETGEHAPQPIRVIGNIQEILGGVPGDSTCAHSRFTHLGAGRYELRALAPWPGEWRFHLVAGDTNTYRIHADGTSGGPGFVLKATRELQVFRLIFDYPSKNLIIQTQEPKTSSANREE